MAAVVMFGPAFDPCCGLLSMNSSVRKKMEQCVAAVFPLSGLKVLYLLMTP